MINIEQMILNAKPKKNGVRAAKVNGDAFKEPLSDLAKYFLGLMFTDGCIHRTKDGRALRVELLLSKIDLEVVKKFKDFLQYEGNIHSIQNKIRVREVKGSKVQYHDKALTHLQISSDPLAKSLIKLGVTERKTYTTKAPELVVNDRNFWRGCIDGDGSLYYNKQRGYSYFTINFVSASRLFTDQFNQFCKVNGVLTSYSKEKVVYKVRIFNNDAFQLATLLYKDCCYAMPRKLSIYEAEVERRNKLSRYWEKT